MKNRIVQFLSALVIAVVATGNSAAGPKLPEWEAITESDWAVGQDTTSNQFDAIMIFEKVLSDEKKLEDDKCYRTIYRRIRILNSNGTKHADVEPPYFQLDQKLEQIKGRTILKDGTVSELVEEQIFEKEVVKTKKQKFKQKYFSLPGVTQDCIIEYIVHYKLTDNQYEWIVQKDIPLLKGEMRWIFAEFHAPEYLSDILNEYLTPNYLWLNYLRIPKTTHLPNLKKATELLFEIDSLPAFESEPYSTPETYLKCKLISYYGTNVPAASYWGKRATDIAENLEDFCKKNRELKKVVKTFGELETKEEKIKAAYDWVQQNIANTTYLDEIEDEDSDKMLKTEKLKENKSANDVIERKYGSRSEIHKVFCDMLREMGIDAKLAYFADRREDMFVLKAKYWQFDFSIVTVVEGAGLYTFYAPGFPSMNIDQIPWFSEGINALVAGADDYFVPIPFTEHDDNKIEIAYQYKIGDDLQLTGRTSTANSGHPGRALRLLLHDEPETDYEKLLLEDFEENQPKAERDSITFENEDKQEEKFIFNCGVKFPALTTMGDRIIFKPFDYTSKAESPFHSDKRKFPILLSYAYERIENVEFALPAGWVVEAMPDSISFSSELGTCKVNFLENGEKIFVKRIFILDYPFWNTNAYVYLKELYQERQATSEMSIVLTKATAATE